MDPCKRLGTGPNGYASLKSHPFFKGIDWDNVRGMTAPKMAPPSTVLDFISNNAHYNFLVLQDSLLNCSDILFNLC